MVPTNNGEYNRVYQMNSFVSRDFRHSREMLLHLGLTVNILGTFSHFLSLSLSNVTFSYILSNGAAQYERSFWSGTGKNRFLGRRGYYSYPLSNGLFYTFFYTADDKGYRKDKSKFSLTISI